MIWPTARNGVPPGRLELRVTTCVLNGPPGERMTVHCPPAEAQSQQAKSAAGRLSRGRNVKLPGRRWLRLDTLFSG